MTAIVELLNRIFATDFATCKNGNQFRERFFERALGIEDLQAVFELINASTATLGGRAIPGALLIKGKESKRAPFAILAQLHGNEPAGQAGILFAMALAQAGLLEGDVLALVGNRLAAAQYYASYAANPKTRQETRDPYRCGLADDGSLLPDLNRIPVDFLSSKATDAHTKRAQELWEAAQHISGILDIHSARGNMVCITDHKRDTDLKHSPIRPVLVELAEAISANASGAVTVQTLKTILHPLENIQCQTGIEAGRHEHPDAPLIAASFTLSTLFSLGLTKVKPQLVKDDGIFRGYRVRPRMTYADLNAHGKVKEGDMVYMATACTQPHSIPPRADRVVVKNKSGKYELQTILEYILTPKGNLAYAIYQFDEMEVIGKGDVVAVAVPSGAYFTAPHDFAGIFFSKSGSLYTKDPAVGPWPLAADKLGNTKFCYPCEQFELKLAF